MRARWKEARNSRWQKKKKKKKKKEEEAVYMIEEGGIEGQLARCSFKARIARAARKEIYGCDEDTPARKQTNKQTNKKNKQTNKQRKKHAVVRSSSSSCLDTAG
mmetsp:Transcript_23281/g.41055  ORF Transcript_23281/g.41055 Transcript_23281/m.41055 type:complete len:104 (+) Transcript_23281:190-501(+)